MNKIKEFKKPIIIFLLVTLIISSIVVVYSNNTVNAKINELSNYKDSYMEEMNNYKMDDYNEKYETYIDWLEASITNNYVKEGARIKELLDDLKNEVIKNNEDMYNSKYDEINLLDINELEEEIKNNINSKKFDIESSKSSNKYKDAIEALDELKESVSNSLAELQKKKEEELKKKEEEARLEEERQREESNKEAEGNNGSEKAGKSKSGQGVANGRNDLPNEQGENEGSYVKNLNAANRTNQLVIVKGQGGSSATVEFHEKDGSGVWRQVFRTSGYVGQNGITYSKREGDRSTPAGVYGFGTGFGVAQNPGANISYRVINDDDCWVDDSGSSHYNTWCSMSAPDKDWNSAEHMIGFPDAYRYGIVIQYNTYDRIPGKGSGIFLHCKTRPTPGCVAIDSNYMVTLLQQINSSALIVIVPNEGDLNNY